MSYIKKKSLKHWILTTNMSVGVSEILGMSIFQKDVDYFLRLADVCFVVAEATLRHCHHLIVCFFSSSLNNYFSKMKKSMF